tara:strand:- start:361 stop:465 length:105 start_codon:yes stop_codon:yes gene_type:complete
MKRTKKQKETKKQVEFDLNKLKPSILLMPVVKKK